MTVELGGGEASNALRAEAAEMAAELRAAGTVPTLAIVLATEDGGAQWYSRAIASAAEKVDVACRLVSLSADASEAEIAAKLEELGRDRGVHGMLMQMPLPAEVDADAMAELIPAEKDIDGMTPLSMGRLLLGRPSFPPATAEAVLRLLKWHGVETAGANVVVIGRSAVVGKPVFHLLLQVDATVTVCHSKTEDLEQIASQADILVVAIGRARFVTADFVRSGATVIDVGTNAAEDGSLVGDVDERSVEGVAGALTPVPGGVGPVTTASLLLHTVEAARALVQAG
jgi:methylenetetrahydrofolate dehydrogenase (NADP+) / methenyltetrahydrofolate cyclohydrolase